MFFRNVLVALGVLFVVAGLALSIIWLNRMENSTAESGRRIASETPATSRPAVLAAARPISSGTLLRPSDIRWKEIGPGELRPGNLQRGQISESDFLGAITRRDFADGDVLVASELVMPGDRRFLAAVLTPGNRAVSIPVNAPQSVAGLVLPGDRVDVILTQSLGDAGVDPRRKSVGETVLRNVRVIAVDQVLSTPANPAAPAIAIPGAEPHVPKTVTLEVNEHQAEMLLVATQLGTVQLSVRPLEATSDQIAEDHVGPPTWASDVSPALGELSASGSTIGDRIRRPPVVSN